MIKITIIYKSTTFFFFWIIEQIHILEWFLFSIKFHFRLKFPLFNEIIISLKLILRYDVWCLNNTFIILLVLDFSKLNFYVTISNFLLTAMFIFQLGLAFNDGWISGRESAGASDQGIGTRMAEIELWSAFPQVCNY